jgi:hypothetical protein
MMITIMTITTSAVITYPDAFAFYAWLLPVDALPLLPSDFSDEVRVLQGWIQSLYCTWSFLYMLAGVLGIEPS